MKGDTRKANDTALNQHAAGAGDNSTTTTERQEEGTEIVAENEEQQEDQPEEKGKTLHSILGITDERAQQLANEVSAAADRVQSEGDGGFNPIRIIEETSKIAQTPLEGFMVGHMVKGALDSLNNPLRGLMQMFGGLGDRG